MSFFKKMGERLDAATETAAQKMNEMRDAAAEIADKTTDTVVDNMNDLSDRLNRATEELKKDKETSE